MLRFPTDTDLIGVWIPALLAGIAVLSLQSKIRELENTVLYSRTLPRINFIHSDQKKKQNKEHLRRFKQGYIVKVFYLWWS